MSGETLTTGRIFADYDRLVQLIEKWMATQDPRLRGCEGGQVKARIVQRIVEIAGSGFALHATRQAETLKTEGSSTPGTLIAGGLRICMQTGRVSITPRLWVRNMFLFAAFWGHFLVFLMAALFRLSPRSPSPATFLMEAGGGYENDDSRFVQYCRQGPIRPLSAAQLIIVKAGQSPRCKTDPRFFYASHPLVFYAVHFLPWSMKLSLLFTHLAAPFLFFSALIHFPLSVLMGRDASYVPLVQWLDQKKLVEAILITNSAFPSQPIWMKGLARQHFQLHMIWYSQNFIPKMYLGEDQRPNLPPARHMRVDVHWVWTAGFRDYLRELGQKGDIQVVGPILWYLPEKIEGWDKSCLKIAVFDVTPLPDGKVPFGAINNYYTATTIQKFISDIVALCGEFKAASGKECLVLLKHKRSPNKSHASSYLKFLDQLVETDPNFKLIDPGTNLFGLLEDCDLSISVPYTSTAYVTAALGKPALYYDPFAELVPQFEENEFVDFASEKQELRQKMSCRLGIEIHS